MIRLSLRILLCSALCGLFCTGALAVGKTTVDPNAGGPAASKAPLKVDTRLAQKVTYEARYVSVRQILEDLTTMTGIKFYAGSNKRDWQVRSRKMNIFVADVTAADLMNSIARAMKFKWSCNDDVTPPTYRLVVDRKAAAAADAQMALAKAKYEEMWRKRRNEWIDAIMEYGSKSGSEIEPLRETNPVLYRYARYGAVQALRALFTEVPEAKTRYAEGRGFRISADKLSADTADLLYYAGNEYWKYLQTRGIVGKWNPEGGYGKMLRPGDKFDIALIRMDEIGGFTPGLRWGRTTQLSTGYFHIMTPDGRDKEMADLRAINEDWSKYLCELNNASLDEEPGPTRQDREEPYRRLMERLKQEEKELYPSEPINEHSEFPELKKTVKLKIETPKTEQNPVLAVNSHIASFQKVLADATGLGVVSDSWIDIEGEKLPDQEATLAELLDKFAEQFNYNWDKPSGVLEFRHRKWWKRRLNQVSDDLVTAWSENTRKNGILSLDDLAQISTLNYDQAEESLKADKVLGTAGIYKRILDMLDRNGNLHWLRLYSTLSPQQRAHLENRWISGAMLSSDQWNLARVMFDRIGSLRSDALFSLRIVPEDSNLIHEFRQFEVSNQGGNDTARQDRTWRVILPCYTPPTRKQDAER